MKDFNEVISSFPKQRAKLLIVAQNRLHGKCHVQSVAARDCDSWGCCNSRIWAWFVIPVSILTQFKTVGLPTPKRDSRVFLIWGWENIKSSMCSRHILAYSPYSFYQSTPNHLELQIQITPHATSPRGKGATSSSFRGGGGNFSWSLIPWRHRAYSTVAQLFRKRSHIIIMYFCPQTRSP